MAKNKLRPLGDITNDLEQVILEMTMDHELQWGEVLNLVRGYMEIHCPGAQETYTEDGSHPVFYYGPAHGINPKQQAQETEGDLDDE